MNRLKELHLLFALITFGASIMTSSCSQQKEAGRSLAEYKIAFVSNRDGNYEIYTMRADGSDLQRVTNEPGHDFAPRWSPDGTKIVFNSNRDGDHEIYVMSLDRDPMGNAGVSTLAKLTDNNAAEWNPHWAPDGKKIVFDSDIYGDDERPKSEICMVDSDGSNWLRMTNNNYRDHDPVISPDGSRVVFLSHRDSTNLKAAEIYIMSSDGSNQRPLTQNRQHETIMSFSPDGSKIIFTQHPAGDNGNDEIYILEIENGSLTNLSNNPASDEHAFWSPDGRKIVFDSTRDGGELQLYLIDPDGSHPTRISKDNSHMDFWSSIWSPDER